MTNDVRVRCLMCGVRGLWRDGVLINPGPGEIPALCMVGPRLRPHGPWLPDVPTRQ